MNHPQRLSLPRRALRGPTGFPPHTHTHTLSLPVFGAQCPRTARPLLAGREDPGNLSRVRTSHPSLGFWVLHRDSCNGITSPSPPVTLKWWNSKGRTPDGGRGNRYYGQEEFSGIPKITSGQPSQSPLDLPLPCHYVRLLLGNSTSTSFSRLEFLYFQEANQEPSLWLWGASWAACHYLHVKAVS